jgi:subtilisin family serine protease
VNYGNITNSQAFGPVTGGDKAIVGGFVGVNAISISDSTAAGNVIGSTNGYLGGFAGMNFGLIQDSTSSGNVTGTGERNVAGGLVGINFGYIDPSQSTGNVTSGPNSIVGGFVGANGAVRFSDGSQFIGTISPDSSGTGQATAGANSTTGPQVGQNYPTSGVPALPTQTCAGVGLCDATLFNPNGTDQPHDQQNVVQISPLLTIVNQFIKQQDQTQPTELIVTVANTPNTGARPTNPGNPGTPPWFGPNAKLPSGLPPLTETRFVGNEVMLQLGNGTPEQIAAVARALGLEIIATENVGMLGRTVYRFRITSGRSVREIIPLLEANKFAVQAQPVYVFQLTQSPAGNAMPPQGDSAQYIVPKLRLPEVHLLATGKDVLVAVVDSAIDVNHPDLAGVIADKFDSAGGEEKPHPHGTGMAGAIVAHKRLLGIAPNARLLAIQAFGVNSGGAQGTSLAIVKGLNWAVEKGARIINMSFAGPKDPILDQAIKAMRAKGIVLIAAAGNAGPKSPPLFPGADPNVIAVSATDADDQVYEKANRGKYVAIAAPGVDILVPAPDGNYQLTTGTSVAAAHVSGVAALLLERNPSLTPDEVRKILTSTATKLKARPEDVGAGLIDPYDALIKIGPKTARAQ